MKLYATVQSERATKGQGGNEYLRINLTIGNAKEQASAGVVEVREISPDVFEVYYHSSTSRTRSKVINTINIRGTVFEAKAKKQKGEKHDCGFPEGRTNCNCL